MTKKIEKFNVFPNNFPENIIKIKHKIMFILHKEGIVERAPFMIDGCHLPSLRQSVIDMKKLGTLTIKNGFMGLSESGLKEYSIVISKQITSDITPEYVIKFMKNKENVSVGSKDVFNELFTDKSERNRSKVTRIFRKLKDSGAIVECSHKSNYRKYYLSDSAGGLENDKK